MIWLKGFWSRLTFGITSTVTKSYDILLCIRYCRFWRLNLKMPDFTHSNIKIVHLLDRLAGHCMVAISGLAWSSREWLYSQQVWLSLFLFLTNLYAKWLYIWLVLMFEIDSDKHAHIHGRCIGNIIWNNIKWLTLIISISILVTLEVLFPPKWSDWNQF